MGSFSGEVFFSRNETFGVGKLQFERPERIMCRSTIFRLGGFAVPSFGDLNGDGEFEIVAGNETGSENRRGLVRFADTTL